MGPRGLVLGQRSAVRELQDASFLREMFTCRERDVAPQRPCRITRAGTRRIAGLGEEGGTARSWRSGAGAERADAVRAQQRSGGVVGGGGVGAHAAAQGCGYVLAWCSGVAQSNNRGLTLGKAAGMHEMNGCAGAEDAGS